MTAWSREPTNGFWLDHTTGKLYAFDVIQQDGVWQRREWLCAIERHWINGVLQGPLEPKE